MDAETAYPDLRYFVIISPVKFRDSISYQAITAPFQILSNTLFTVFPVHYSLIITSFSVI
jgi:hypothetical protein